MQLLVRKLHNYLPLTEGERHAILQLPVQTREVAPRTELSGLAGAPGAVHLINDGFACRYKFLPDGRRQILSFLVPGDVSDLRQFILGRTDPAVSSLSPLSLSIIPRDAMLSLTEAYPRITRALWWGTLVEESITQEWLVNIGQRSALERMAHLLCELFVRLSVVGKTEGRAFDMPITQTELADTLGLSTVHVNRTLQELKRMDVIAAKGRTVRLVNLERLQQVAMFAPDYLHLRSEAMMQRPGEADRPS